jgi:tetratricopeptide (TPR) repeat protein
MNIRVSPRAALALSVLLGFLSLALQARAADEDIGPELLSIEHAWDQANYGITDPAAKRSSLEALSEQAEQLVRAHPDRAEPLVWQGIVLSTYAAARGGFGALSLAKRSRDCLLAAVKLDGSVLHGSAYTSLGALYYKVPGFPVGFGDHERAAEYLQKALALNPDGIDPNYFYGELLFENGDYAQALRYLQKALDAPPRPDRPLADSGRRTEVNALIAKVRAKLS